MKDFRNKCERSHRVRGASLYQLIWGNLMIAGNTRESNSFINSEYPCITRGIRFHSGNILRKCESHA